MTPEAAIHQWMSGFDMPAYAATATPSDAEFPYLTYDLVMGEWGDGEVNMPVNLWFRTDSEAVPNAKVREMRDELKFGGVTLPCDGGMVWLKQGSPWAQAIRVDGEDDKVKRRYVNIDVEYLISG